MTAIIVPSRRVIDPCDPRRRCDAIRDVNWRSPQADGLFMALPMAEGSGITISSVGTFGHGGSCYLGSPSWGLRGPLGPALNLGLTRIELGAISAIQNAQRFAISSWIYSPVEEHDSTVISASSGSYNQNIANWYYDLALGTYGNLLFCQLGNGTDGDTACVMRDYIARWMHVGIIFDGTIANATQRVQYYIDGLVQPLASGYSSYSYPSTSASLPYAWIGDYIVDPGGVWRSAYYLQDLRIYREMTPEQMWLAYSNPRGLYDNDSPKYDVFDFAAAERRRNRLALAF